MFPALRALACWCTYALRVVGFPRLAHGSLRETFFLPAVVPAFCQAWCQGHERHGVSWFLGPRIEYPLLEIKTIAPRSERFSC